jgi:heat-inducible transcriptional repressor
MEQRPLGHTELQTIRHQFDTPHSEAEEWLKLAATVMAHSMHNVGLATAPRAIEMRLRHLEVISIQNAIALLIVVLQDGTVLREMLQLAEVWSQEALSALADRLNLDLRGMTAGQIELKVQVYSGLDAAVAQVAAHLLRRGESEHAQVFHAGLADMIRQPEFLALRPGESLGLMNERLGFMVDFLQQGFGVERLVAGLPVGAGVRIVIGGETTIPGLQDYSFVLGRYGAEEESSGYLGIVGPTRMEYPRAVALVQYMTDIVTDVIHPY